MERIIVDDYRKLCDYTDEQFRAYVTVYCLENDISVDTNRWDNLMYDLYNHYYAGNLSEQAFDTFMSEDLV